MFNLFVCIFTLQLSKAIYKPLNTRSLCLCVFPIVPAGYFDVSLFLNCVALSLNHPYFSFFPTPIINTTIPLDPLPPCSVTPQPLLLLPSFHHYLLNTDLYDPPPSLSLSSLIFHILFASLSIYSLYSVCPPFIHLSFHFIFTSRLLLSFIFL